MKTAFSAALVWWVLVGMCVPALANGVYMPEPAVPALPEIPDGLDDWGRARVVIHELAHVAGVGSDTAAAPAYTNVNAVTEKERFQLFVPSYDGKVPTDPVQHADTLAGFAAHNWYYRSY
jgi:hypothetical protein